MRLATLSLPMLVLLAACEGTLGERADGGRLDGGTPSTTDTGARLDAPASDTGAPDTPPGDAPSADPLAEARRICLEEINRLRATRSLPAYSAWTGVEACADDQATDDEMSGEPHGAWRSGAFATCNGNAQNECLGGGAAGIVGCLQRMWAERELAGCAGCDACADAYDPSCPGCDFFGTSTGDVCGHYVNMSARYFDQVVCGFSDEGGWAIQNFR
jgi:hypothetical protein